MTIYIITFLVSIIGFNVLFYNVDEKRFSNSTFYVSFGLSIFIQFMLFACLFSLNNIKMNCKESNQLEIPQIIYANDSSFKTLIPKNNAKIRIMREDSLFKVNDSVYLIEPCENEIILKKGN